MMFALHAQPLCLVCVCEVCALAVYTWLMELSRAATTYRIGQCHPPPAPAPPSLSVQITAPPELTVCLIMAPCLPFT